MITTFLIPKRRFFQYLEVIISQSAIDTLIVGFVFLQLNGETTHNQNMMNLKPIPIILMIIKSLWVVDCCKMITCGLFFGLIADLLLMFPSVLLLQFGAVFFLIGHIFYITSFVKGPSDQESSFKLLKPLQYTLSLAIFATLAFNAFTLWNYLPDRVLFILYGAVLSSMAVTAFFRKSSHPMMLSYLYGVMGAISFVISDYLIAYTRFMELDIGINGALIMGLYYLSQFMILKGNSTSKKIMLD